MVVIVYIASYFQKKIFSVFLGHFTQARIMIMIFSSSNRLQDSSWYHLCLLVI